MSWDNGVVITTGAAYADAVPAGTPASGSAVTLTLPLTQSGGKVYDAGADIIGIFAEILGK